MNWSKKYDFKQFQDELAALDRRLGSAVPDVLPARALAPASPLSVSKRRGRPPKVDPLAQARVEFDELRLHYGLSVADVVAWFPPEHGVAYLKSLIANAPSTRRISRKKAMPDR